MSEIKLRYGPIGSHASETLGTSIFAPEVPAIQGRCLLVQALAQNVRYTVDGTDPTASFGFRLVAGDEVLAIPLGEGAQLQFIREASGAILEYQWAE